MSVITSENGWPVLVRDQLHWFTAAGERFAAANADVAHLAAYLINHFNSEVEPLDGPVHDDWSWATRPVTGRTTGFSNHASATGWDLNALRHPRGAHGTFTPEQAAAVRKILAKIADNEGRRIFRWGNDYKVSPVDAMHFEIDASPEQVRQARAKLENEESKPQEDDVSFQDQHTLTEWDAAAYGPPAKAGDKKSYDELLRNPPAVVRLRREMAAAQVAQAIRDKEQALRMTGLAADVIRLAGTVTEALAAITAIKPAAATGDHAPQGGLHTAVAEPPVAT